MIFLMDEIFDLISLRLPHLPFSVLNRFLLTLALCQKKKKSIRHASMPNPIRDPRGVMPRTHESMNHWFVYCGGSPKKKKGPGRRLEWLSPSPGQSMPPHEMSFGWPQIVVWGCASRGRLSTVTWRRTSHWPSAPPPLTPTPFISWYIFLSLVKLLINYVKNPISTCASE